MNRFTVYYLNFAYASPQRFASLETALDYARNRGFQATILRDDVPVASWCPIGGTKLY